MTDQPEPEDLTGAWTPDPPIGCLLPDVAPAAPPEATGGPQSAREASGGATERRDGHGGAEGASGGSGPIPHFHLAPAGLRAQIVASLDDFPVAYWAPGSIASRIMPLVGAAFDQYRDKVGGANNGEQSSRTTPDNPPASSDSLDNPHAYLSTGCYHDDHTYCQSMTGLNGAKRPGECKFCGAPCQCPCHQQTTADSGPSVAECAEADRNWDVQKTGE
ncbi:hypothetical protein [Streptomyces sp. NBC_01530]|uniref:hypothetical protein n=1 Tax=Streptomyces sp. NBC_01530 TaxID=2903895 RepID=UPI003864D073